MPGDMRLSIIVDTIDRASGGLRGIAGTVQREAKGMGASLFAAGEQGEAARQKLQALGSAATQVGAQLAVVSGAILGVAAMSVKAASDVEEMTSKFNVVFGEQARAVESWADSTGADLNRSKYDLMGYAATLQDTFVPMGMARDEASGLSKQITTLAVDMASFNNVAEPIVIRDLQSALVGNHETMRKYGVVITQARLDQELLNMGFEGGAKSASELQKMMARVNIIMQGTQDAQGDAARTSGEFANQMRGLKGELKEVAVEIGKALLPILQAILPPVKTFLGIISGIIRSPFGKFFAVAGAGLGVLLGIIGGGLIVFGQLAGALTSIGHAAALLQGAEGFAGLASAAGGLTGMIGSLGTAVSGLGAVLLAVAPYAIAGLAIAALAYELYKLKGAYDEAAAAGREMARSQEELAESRRRSVEMGYAAPGVVAAQEAEIAQAVPTLGERISGWFWPGITGQMLAEQRVSSAQPSEVWATRQLQRGREGGAQVQVTQHYHGPVYGPRDLEEQMERTTRDGIRRAMVGAR